MTRQAYTAPEGHPANPLDAEPYTLQDQRDLLAWWNAAVPDMDGLLDALVVSGEDRRDGE